jgi:tRNA A-37 threonylcarbamoyl transferase component Bud32
MQSTFLGQGSTGRVFLVDQLGEPRALKVFRGDGAFQHERMMYPSLSRAGLAIPTLLDSKCIVHDGVYWGALLLSKVGKKKPRPESKSDRRYTSALAALKQFHTAGFVHGDARWANVVWDGENPFWIDFQHVSDVNGQSDVYRDIRFEHDLKEFDKSSCAQ